MKAKKRQDGSDIWDVEMSTEELLGLTSLANQLGALDKVIAVSPDGDHKIMFQGESHDVT